MKKGIFVGGPHDGDKISNRDEWPAFFLGPFGSFMRSFSGRQPVNPEHLAQATYRYDRTNKLDSQGRLIYQYRELGQSETRTLAKTGKQPR